MYPLFYGRVMSLTMSAYGEKVILGPSASCNIVHGLATTKFGFETGTLPGGLVSSSISITTVPTTTWWYKAEDI